MSIQEIILKAQNLRSEIFRQGYGLHSVSEGEDTRFSDFFEIIQGDEFNESFKLLTIRKLLMDITSNYFTTLRRAEVHRLLPYPRHLRRLEFLRNLDPLHTNREQSDNYALLTRLRHYDVLYQSVRNIFTEEDIKGIDNQVISTYPEKTRKELERGIKGPSIVKRPWNYDHSAYCSHKDTPQPKKSDKPPLLENVYSPKGIQRIINTQIEALLRYIDYRSFYYTKNPNPHSSMNPIPYLEHKDIYYRSRVHKETLDGSYGEVDYAYYQMDKTAKERPNYYGGFLNFFKIGYSKDQKINAAKALIAVLEAKRDNKPVPALSQKQWAVLHEPGSKLGRIVKTVDWLLATLGKLDAFRQEIYQGTKLPKDLQDIIEEYSPLAIFT